MDDDDIDFSNFLRGGSEQISSTRATLEEDVFSPVENIVLALRMSDTNSIEDNQSVSTILTKAFNVFKLFLGIVTVLEPMTGYSTIITWPPVSAHIVEHLAAFLQLRQAMTDMSSGEYVFASTQDVNRGSSILEHASVIFYQNAVRDRINTVLRQEMAHDLQEKARASMARKSEDLLAIANRQGDNNFTSTEELSQSAQKLLVEVNVARSLFAVSKRIIFNQNLPIIGDKIRLNEVAREMVRIIAQKALDLSRQYYPPPTSDNFEDLAEDLKLIISSTHRIRLRAEAERSLKEKEKRDAAAAAAAAASSSKNKKRIIDGNSPPRRKQDQKPNLPMTISFIAASSLLRY
jgi:hypothetical protein